MANDNHFYICLMLSTFFDLFFSPNLNYDDDDYNNDDDDDDEQHSGGSDGDWIPNKF